MPDFPPIVSSGTVRVEGASRIGFVQGDGPPNPRNLSGRPLRPLGGEPQRVVVVNLSTERPFTTQTAPPLPGTSFWGLAQRAFNPVVIFTAREAAVRLFNPVKAAGVPLGAIPSNLSEAGREAIARIEAFALRREEARAEVRQAVESQEAAVFGGGANVGAQAVSRGSGPVALIINALSVPVVTSAALSRVEEGRALEAELTQAILSNLAIVRQEKAVAFRDLGLSVSDLGEPVFTAAMPAAGEADLPGGVILAGPADPVYHPSDK